jgi:extracellular matrix regulatory protein A
LNGLVNIGFGNIVNSKRIVSIISPDAAPVKRMVQTAKDNGTAVDATCGRKTRAVIVTDSGHLVLSALLPETIANRVNSKEEMDQKGEDDE